MKLPRLVFASLVLIVSPHLGANVVPAALFNHGAVLQQGKPIPIWGRADAGEAVTVSFAGQTATTTADASGRWQVQLPALSASAEPRELVISGHNRLSLRKILVGEVWLAAGQSNMDMALRNTANAETATAAANDPLLRIFKVRRKVSDTPADDVAGDWKEATPANAPVFSAVSYYYAARLRTALGVPVGIVNSSVGGTQAESWTPASTLAANPALSVIGQRWGEYLAAYPAAKATFDAGRTQWEKERDEAKAAGTEFKKYPPNPPRGPGHNDQPSGLFNGMIAPLAPGAFRGFLWYQGESNAKRASEYRVLLPALITGLREHFTQGDLPFYWVQLPNYGLVRRDGDDWAWLREAQSQALTLPATGQAVALDLGDSKDIHPRNKKEVADRLARLALARCYGATIIDGGPVFSTAVAEGGAQRVFFKNLQGELAVAGDRLSEFTLAGEDKKFHPAEARIDGASVVVTSSAVSKPVAVRYAWRDDASASLRGADGLPVAPFRSDNW